MNFLRRFGALARRLRFLFLRHRVERELDDEIQYHLARQVEQNVAAGMAPDEAQYAAQRLFGGIDQQKERSRDVSRIRWMEDLARDLRHGAHALLHSPAFTTVTVLTL